PIPLPPPHEEPTSVLAPPDKSFRGPNGGINPMVKTAPHAETAAASRIDERRQLIATAGAGLLYQHGATRLECFDAQRSKSIVRRADDRELDAVGSERVGGR